MVKNVLTGAFVALIAISASAQTKVFQSEELGEVYGVSNNGEYAVISDDENIRSYLWTRTTGEMVEISEARGASSVPSGQRVKGTYVYGVNDNGTVVGSLVYADGVERPSIYKNGKWSNLPLSEFAMNTNAAIGITNDEVYICGYQFFMDPDSAVGGRYRPCRWTLQQDGTYSLDSYGDIDVLNHQGFYPLCMSPDGRLIGGKVYAGVDCEMAAYMDFETGEFHVNHEIKIKSEPWIYKGKYYCGIDENGKQIWSSDPNDPRIVMFNETYIDGIKSDGTEESKFSGYFTGIDNEGCLYGRRSVASDVDSEEGTGTIKSFASIYNSKTGEWKDNTSAQGYSGGLNNGAYIFGIGNVLYVDNQQTTFTGEFDFTYSKTLSNLNRCSLNGQVIGGCVYEVNPATGEPQYFPIIIELDHELVSNVGVQQIGGENASVLVRVSGRMLEVAGADAVAVYDMQGRTISRNAVSSVDPGMYVVVADGNVTKIIVK